MMSPYIVTVTPRFPRWNWSPFEVKVYAKDKATANKRARAILESEGHFFRFEDACTFRAKLVEDQPSPL